MTTVVIPTHNPGTRLRRCLDALAAQTTREFQILLVDSRGTDNSAAEGLSHWQSKKIPVAAKMVREEKPGAQAARLLGAREAETPLIVFCDDDNLLAPNYLETARTLAERHPEAGLIGGYGVGATMDGSALPDWFSQVGLCLAAPGIPRTPVEMKPIAGTWTAGMVVRKKVFERLDAAKFEPILTGRVGASLVAGEDIEMCKAAALAGFPTFEDSRLVFEHLMNPSRLDAKTVNLLSHAMGTARWRHRPYDYFLVPRLQTHRASAWQHELSSSWRPALKSLFLLACDSSVRHVEARVCVTYFATILRERRGFLAGLDRVRDFQKRCAALS